MGKEYPREIRDAVIQARQSGMLVKDICRKYHVCDQTIRDWMKANANVVGRTSLKKPPIRVSLHIQSSRENGRFSDEERREVSLSCIKRGIPSQISANRSKSEEVHCIAGLVSIPNFGDIVARSSLRRKFLRCVRKIACCGKKMRYCINVSVTRMMLYP